jgi:hypothetical protein
MSFKEVKNYNKAKMQQKVPAAKISKSEYFTIKENISPEKRKKVERIILDTLGFDCSESLNNFDKKLKEAIKSLPQYKQIKRKLEKVEHQSLPYELFKVIKKNLNKKQINPNAPKDGVLIKSIKQGMIECAGITLLASTFLQEKGINHVVVFAPGHVFLVIEQSPSTLIYFDVHQNLYFTFPKQALEGYKGTKISAECELKQYTPREWDFFDGINPIFSHFVVTPALEGIGRLYLRNVAAALNGNKEFQTSNIIVDKKAGKAVYQIEFEIYGANKTLESFYERIKDFIKQDRARMMNFKNFVMEIFKAHPKHDDFIAFFITALDSNIDIGKIVPYLKNVSLEKKIIYGEKVWSFLKQKSMVNKIGEE